MMMIGNHRYLTLSFFSVEFDDDNDDHLQKKLRPKQTEKRFLKMKNFFLFFEKKIHYGKIFSQEIFLEIFFPGNFSFFVYTSYLET